MQFVDRLSVVHNLEALEHVRREVGLVRAVSQHIIGGVVLRERVVAIHACAVE